MRHPHKFSRALGVSYSITFAVDVTMGIVGYLMFGRYVFEEVIIYPSVPLMLDHAKYFRYVRLPPHPQLRCGLGHRNHSNYKNAIEYSSNQYHSRYSPWIIPDLYHIYNVVIATASSA